MKIEKTGILYELLRMKIGDQTKPLTNEKIRYLSSTFRVKSEDMCAIIRKELKV
jgi:hypothetical protein